MVKIIPTARKQTLSRWHD